VGEAGDPKGLPQVLGQGHHRAAEHQGRQQPASFGAGAGQKPFRDLPTQVGDGGGWAGDHLQRLHPETGPGALAGETFRGPRQQGMGSRPGAPQQALHLQTPPLPQLVAGGQPQLGAPPSQLKERLAGAIGVTLGIGRQGALQHHECAGPFALQSPHGIMGAWLGGRWLAQSTRARVRVRVISQAVIRGGRSVVWRLPWMPGAGSAVPSPRGAAWFGETSGEGCSLWWRRPPGDVRRRVTPERESPGRDRPGREDSEDTTDISTPPAEATINTSGRVPRLQPTTFENRRSQPCDPPS